MPEPRPTPPQPPGPQHLPRLTRLMQQLHALLHQRRSGTLGTWPLPASDPATSVAAAAPSLSFVPYAIDAAHGALLLHVSALAAHTRQMQAQPAVSLLVCAAEADGQPVHALQRVALQGQAALLQGDDADAARTAYLARFPEAEPMTALADFRFVRLTPLGARHVAGFGAARDVAGDELRALLRLPRDAG